MKAEGRKSAHYTTAENALNVSAGKSVWDNMLDRIIIWPALRPDVIKQAIAAELRSQGVALLDQLVCVSDIPLRQPG